MTTYTIPARKLATGDKIYDVQIEGERIERKTPATVVRVHKHGPCITVQTDRSPSAIDVEYDENEPVRVTATTHKRYTAGQ